jgi:hypothetical protein
MTIYTYKDSETTMENVMWKVRFVESCFSRCVSHSEWEVMATERDMDGCWSELRGKGQDEYRDPRENVRQ